MEIPSYRIKTNKRTIPYDQAIKLIKIELLKVKQDRKLQSFCTEHNLSYTFISGFINDKRKAPVPKLAQKLFLAFGIQTEIKTTIDFEIIPTDN